MDDCGCAWERAIDQEDEKGQESKSTPSSEINEIKEGSRKQLQGLSITIKSERKKGVGKQTERERNAELTMSSTLQSSTNMPAMIKKRLVFASFLCEACSFLDHMLLSGLFLKLFLAGTILSSTHFIFWLGISHCCLSCPNPSLPPCFNSVCTQKLVRWLVPLVQVKPLSFNAAQTLRWKKMMLHL